MAGKAACPDATKASPRVPPKVKMQLSVSGSHLEHHGHVHPSGLEDLDSTEAEPTRGKVEVGVGTCALMWRGQGWTHGEEPSAGTGQE